MFKKPNKNDIEFTVSNQTVIRVVVLVIISLMGLAAINKAAHALTLIFLGLFVALALNAPVSWLARQLPGKRRGNRTLATAISFIIIMALIIGFIVSIIPPLVRQTTSFIDAAPSLIENLRSDDNTLGRLVRRHHLEPQVKELSDQLASKAGNVTGTAFSTISRIGSSIFATLTVLVLAFMMLVEGKRWFSYVEQFIPPAKVPRFERTTRHMYQVVRGYVNGQVMLAALAACVIVVPLFILDISYPIALMVIVFICGLIPLVGHSIGAIIVTLVALFTSLPSAITILAFYILYQQIENYALQPRIQASATNMSPLLVFMSVVIGVSFGGLLGGLLAIPIAGCARVLLIDLLEPYKTSSSTRKEE